VAALFSDEKARESEGWDI